MKMNSKSFAYKSLFYLFLVPVFFLASCSKDEDDPENFNKDHSLNKKSVGYSAHDLLSADKYKSVIVEMQYVQGFEPTQTAVMSRLPGPGFRQSRRRRMGHTPEPPTGVSQPGFAVPSTRRTPSPRQEAPPPHDRTEARPGSASPPKA